MKTITLYFAGRRRTFRRPEAYSRREWRHPKRDRNRLDDMKYSRTTYPGELILRESHHNGEGISYRQVIVNFDEETMIKVSGGTDCDGHTSEARELALVGGEWVEEGRRCYDQFAQAAGY